MKKSFSMIELIIVMVVIGILAASMKFSLPNTTLNQAVDQIINHIRYTQQLALRDDKYQSFPLDSSAKEGNRSKFWFKQWWHFKITNAGDDIIYYIFSDSATGSKTTTFDNKTVTSAQYTVELAKSALDQTYIIGANSDDTGNSNYPPKIDTYKRANLSKYYGIKKVILSNAYSSSSMPDGKGDRVDMLFDSYGTVYMREGDTGSDATDTNPYDTSERKKLTDTAKITLCLDDNCEQNKSICIYSETGYVKTCD